MAIFIELLMLKPKMVGGIQTVEDIVWSGEIDWTGQQPDVISYTTKDGMMRGFVAAYSRHLDGPDNGKIVHYYRERTHTSIQEV